MPRNKAEHRPDGQPARKREVERRGAMKVVPLDRKGWGAVSLGAGHAGNSQDENQSVYVGRFVLLGDEMHNAELAQAMGVSEKDATAFVECLRVWIAKGYSLDQAIEKHMQQMRRMVNEAYEAISNPCKTDKAGAMKRAAADLVWEAVN